MRRDAVPPVLRASLPGPRPGPGGRTRQVGSWLWAFLPLISCGILAWVPILHAALRIRRRFLAWSTAGYVAATVAVFVLLSLPESTSVAVDVATTLAVLGLPALAVGGTVHALLLRSRVFFPSSRTGAQSAYEDAQAARQRRIDACALAKRDPAMARDLRIGRPDLPRRFDDGGLVDVNHVPKQTLVDVLGLTAEDAERIVTTRNQIDRFSLPDELIVLAGLEPVTVDWIRDRLIFLSF